MLVKYKLQNIFRCGDFRLIPGNNDVETAKWNHALTNYPKIKWLIEEGHIETFDVAGNIRQDDEAAAPVAKGEVLEAVDLTKVAEKKAIKLVKDTFETNLLNTWHAAEKRPKVIEAIEAQFEAVAKALEPKKDEG